MTRAEAADRPYGGMAARISGLAISLAGLSGWRRLAAAAGLGVVATLSAPPAYAVPVLLIAFPGLLWILDGASDRRTAFLVGWTFGFGFFVPGLYWIAFALTVDLASFFWLIPFAVAGLPALLAVFTGAATLALHMLSLSGVPRVLAFAAFWGLAEWLRGHVLTGFPWQLVGYGWVGWGPVLQSVSVIGMYGLSLLTVLAAALPAAMVNPGKRQWSRGGVTAGLAALVGLAVIAGAGAVRLTGQVEDVPGVRLRLVQPNIAQTDKWDPALAPQNFVLHLELSRRLGPAPVTHIIWPETAVPYAVGRDPAIRQAIADATPPGGLIITGTPRLSEAPRRVWNSLAAVDDRGEVVGTFDKFHLVPFGEYVPLRGILPIDKITPGRLDFSPGPGPRTVDLPGLPPVSPLICYEVIFPGAVTDRDADGARPRWLLNLTNDAWYGQTAGPHQHFAITRARAVEEGIPLVRVATTGISGVVDPYGRVVASLPLGTQGVVDSPLPKAIVTPTMYARWQNSSFWAITLMLVSAAVFRGRMGRRS